MKTFNIYAPVAGVVSGRVQAATKEEALEILRAHWYEGVKLEEANGDNYSLDVGQLEVYEHLVQGNVVYADCWEIAINEEKEERK